jgi:hypothetical protein
MPVFKITFDDSGDVTATVPAPGGLTPTALEGRLAAAFDAATVELEGEAAQAVTAVWRQDHGLPEGILGVESARLTLDDSSSWDLRKGEASINAFASVVLLAEAESEDDAARIEPPADLLAAVVERLLGPAPQLPDGVTQVGFSGDHAWEVLASEPAPESEPAAGLTI